MDELHQLLIETDGVQLRWNVSGVDASGAIDPQNFAVRLFTVDFKKGEGGFDAPLGSQEIARLHAFLSPFVEQLGKAGDSSGLRVVESTASVDAVSDLLPKLDDAALVSVLNSIITTEKLDWLAKNLTRVDTEELEASLWHVRRRTALDHLDTLVDEDTKENGDVGQLCDGDDELRKYAAGQPETVFQRWFEANPWVLGREYVRRHPLRVIGIDSEADLVMETTDGYLDLVELKRPLAKVLALKKGGSSGKKFHYLHSDLSAAYGQCVRYLADLEDFKHQLQEKSNARIVAPRVFLILGRSRDLGSKELDSLRRIESTFHQIQILTYDQVLAMGRQLIGDTPIPGP